MKHLGWMAGVALTGGLLMAGAASAADMLELKIVARADPGFTGGLGIYDQSIQPPLADFSGNTVAIDVVIRDLATSPFVQSLSINWGKQPSEYLTQEDAYREIDPRTGEDRGYDFKFSLEPNGATISTFLSAYLGEWSDGNVQDSLSFVLSQPWDMTTPFFDSDASGSGRILKRTNQDPSSYGVGDKSSAGTFTILSVEGIVDGVAPVIPVGGVPEPTAWALMIMGVTAIGAATRRRRVATV